MTLVALGLAWPGTRVRSPGSGLVLGRDRHWGNRLPLFYGSAWKEDQTATNVVDAVLAGFRGVDTACQPQHYREDLVGEALRTLAAKHGIGREAVWLQTSSRPRCTREKTCRTTPRRRCQTRSRRASRCRSRISRSLPSTPCCCHGPLETHERTMEAWRAMERQVELGFVTQLGISNLHDVRRFERIYEEAAVKPRVLQKPLLAAAEIRLSDIPRPSGYGDPDLLSNSLHNINHGGLLGPH